MKLTQLSKAELEVRQMDAVKGGTCCGCGCHYFHNGGSSTGKNGNENYKYGYTSIGGDKACWNSGGYFTSTC